MARIPAHSLKGNKLHDKRATEKGREWNLDKQRILKMTR
jgi:tmRNA-binding protein